MYKRYLVLPLVLFLLAAFYSTAHAVPNKESDIVVWPIFWQWESPWGVSEDYLYAGKRTYKDGKLSGKWMRDYGCLVTSLAMLLRYYGLTWRPNDNHEPELIPGCVINPLYCLYTGPFIKTNPGTLNEWFTRNKLYNKNDDLIEGAVKYYYIRGSWWNWYNFVEPNYDCLGRRQHGIPF